MALNRWRCSAVELGTEHGRASMLTPPLEVKRGVHRRCSIEDDLIGLEAEERRLRELYEEAQAKTAAVRAELATAQAEELAAWRAAYPTETER